LILVVVACNDINRPKKPDNLISKNKMVGIITDISLINAAKGTNKKLIEGNNINPENYVFQKYDIDSLQFAESNHYYAYDVKEYEDIYLKVKQGLQDKKKENKAIQDKERKEKDSLIKLRKRTKDSVKRSKLLKEPMPSGLRGKIGKPKQ